MARKLRVEYPGAIYHLMNRGDRKEVIFLDDRDRRRFLDTLGECCAKTGWLIHAYVLMPNHFHLVVETPRANLVAGMKWFLGTVTSRFNGRHRLVGHLFAGRYKALIVDGSGTGYLKSVCDYVHLNPVRAKLVSALEPLRGYAWSSLPAYLGAPFKRPVWLRVERLLGEYRIPRDSVAGRRLLEESLESRRREEGEGDLARIRRGWCLGDAAFRHELLGRMTGRVGAEHYGKERAEADAEKAERIALEEMKRRRMTEEDLRRRSKGDEDKVAIAVRLRAETIRTVGWIADRLRMGSRAYLHHLLWRARKRGAKQTLRP